MSRLGGATALVLVAFAANSVLNRMAVGGGAIDALAFANIRAVAGAAMLGALLLLRGGGLPRFGAGRLLGAGSLTLYLAGFSVAYEQMDAGLGALILFGCVQVTMFAGSVAGGERPPARRWIGAGLALAGLAWLGWPGGAAAAPPTAVAAMGLAGLGWGVYSLAGRRAADALSETAANFLWSVPLLLGLTALIPARPEAVAPTPLGIGLAVVAGAVTSGLGYALWYRVLPRLGGSRAALVQLLVPVIAAAAGAVLLGEGVTRRMLAAGALTLGGIAYGLAPPAQRRIGSSGS